MTAMKTIVEQAQEIADGNCISDFEGRGHIINGVPFDSPEDLRKCLSILEAANEDCVTFKWSGERSEINEAIPRDVVIRSRSNVQDRGWFIESPCMESAGKDVYLWQQYFALDVWSPEYYKFVD